MLANKQGPFIPYPLFQNKSNLQFVVQVVEHQSSSGLPHAHGVGWTRGLSPELSSLLGRLQKNNAVGLSREELRPVVLLAKRMTTVSTCPKLLKSQFPSLTEIQAQEVSALALKLQVHPCSSSCEKRIPAEGQQCCMFFPKLPSLIAIVATTPPSGDQYRLRLEKIENFQIKVQEELRRIAGNPDGHLTEEQGDHIKTLCSLIRTVEDSPASDGSGGLVFAGTIVPGGEETDGLRNELKSLGVSSAEDLDLMVCYHFTLLTRRHNKYLPVRTVEESFIVSYNPWILLATKANGEAELITHTLSSVFRYVTKGTDPFILKSYAQELRKRRDNKREEDMANYLERLVKASEGTNDRSQYMPRVVTLGEAFRLLDPRMTLSSSNGPSVVFISCAVVADPTPSRILKSEHQAKVRDYMRKYGHKIEN